MVFGVGLEINEAFSRYEAMEMAKGTVAVKQPGFTTFKAGEYEIIIPGVAKTNIEFD